MDKQFVTTSASPHIQLDVSGDLRLKGQDELEVIAKADDPESLTLETQDDQVVIRCMGSCSVRVPRDAVVQVQAVHRDAAIKAIDGDVLVDQVDGDLEMRNLGNIQIGAVHGDLAIKNVDGNLNIDSVDGEISARSVQGDFNVAVSAHGNLTLSDIGGSAKATVDGNIFLRLDPAPSHEYQFSCHGNIFCRLSGDSSAEINVPKASQVMVNLPGIHASAPIQSPYALTLGEGDAKITLSADGNVALDTRAPDWGMEDLDFDISSEVEGMADVVSQQINQQVESQVRMIEDQLNAQLSSLSMRLSSAQLSADQARKIEDRAREASERAAARAQQRVQRAQQKMEQKLAAAQRKMEAAQRKMEYKARAYERVGRHSRHSVSFGFPPSSTRSAPTGEPVSEDERLMILHMLEDKKITMEEAEQLLTALEGKA
jgi:hypothetical protein